jgi:hypothetical protein
LVLDGVESYHRLTKQQHAYAVARGRLPTNIPDWQCRLIADGWSEADIKAVVGRKQSNAISANLAKWNAMPAVQSVIEYERAVAQGVSLRGAAREAGCSDDTVRRVLARAGACWAGVG